MHFLYLFFEIIYICKLYLLRFFARAIYALFFSIFCRFLHILSVFFTNADCDVHSSALFCKLVPTIFVQNLPKIDVYSYIIRKNIFCFGGINMRLNRINRRLFFCDTLRAVLTVQIVFPLLRAAIDFLLLL